MRTTIKVSLIFILFSLVFTSCKKESETVTGCTDPFGDNYNAEATVDNGSCTFQKRFLGDYSGDFMCGSFFATVFSKADLSVIELVKKDTVNIIIQTAIGPLPVKGGLTKTTISVNSTIPNLKINPSDIFLGATGDPILVDGKVITVLTISDDNKKLTGDLMLTLITKEETNVGGAIIEANKEIVDVCGFVGTKK